MLVLVKVVVVIQIFSQPPVPTAMIVDIYNRTGDLDLVRRCLPGEFYYDLALVAESEWDFSSRLIRNEYDLTTTATTSIIPVDLNAFLLKPSDVTSGPVSPMDARRPRNDSDPNDSR
ncbi:hypothetical protein T459_12363 [Capsicum annuum]|uniref:Trehalase n=1 Tax=Capsicum annuum TaxID=4072 RepID=A0A2G2ZPK1_CAPAN|nr:hypothetical protein T459_12363 [Capsicum annuum]